MEGDISAIVIATRLFSILALSARVRGNTIGIVFYQVDQNVTS
jgi:hypothetical protein